MRVVICALALLLLATPSWAEEVPGTLHLSSRPVTNVEIDGVFKGTTDETRRGIQMAPGTYEVRFVCEVAECADLRLRTGKKTLSVDSGERTRYHADFYALNSVDAPARAPKAEAAEAPPAELPPEEPAADVSPAPGEPAGTLKLGGRPRARVYIGGAYVGSTDELKTGIAVAPGEHSVRFVCDAPECADFQRRSGKKTLVVGDGEDVTYVVDFFGLNSR